MEFKSIEFTGDHSIKTTYMAGEVDQDEYTVTCRDLPRPELRTTGLAILPGVLTMTLGDDAISCLKKRLSGLDPGGRAAEAEHQDCQEDALDAGGTGQGRHQRCRPGDRLDRHQGLHGRQRTGMR